MELHSSVHRLKVRATKNKRLPRIWVCPNRSWSNRKIDYLLEKLFNKYVEDCVNQFIYQTNNLAIRSARSYWTKTLKWPIHRKGLSFDKLEFSIGWPNSGVPLLKHGISLTQSIRGSRFKLFRTRLFFLFEFLGRTLSLV